jgi:hypothetical protein
MLVAKMKIRAFIIGVAALFLATGTAHAERYTPTSANTLANTLPPAEYDKPFPGKLQEFVAKDQEELAGFCPNLEGPALGCAQLWRRATESNPAYCNIYLAPEERIRKFGLTTEIVRRHEIGHCNGWVHGPFGLPSIDPWNLKVMPSTEEKK